MGMPDQPKPQAAHPRPAAAPALRLLHVRCHRNLLDVYVTVPRVDVCSATLQHSEVHVAVAPSVGDADTSPAARNTLQVNAPGRGLDQHLCAPEVGVSVMRRMEAAVHALAVELFRQPPRCCACCAPDHASEQQR